MTRDEALELLRRHIKNENLIRHSLAAEALMKGLAGKLGQDEQKWGLAGLLHDLDWEETRENFQEHSLKSYEYLRDTGIDPEVALAIKRHNPVHKLELVTLLDKALYSAEEITGLITAAALVQPDKKLASLTPESVMRKFKNKAFAAGVDRDIVSQVEPLLGITVEELVGICLEEMREIADELGL